MARVRRLRASAALRAAGRRVACARAHEQCLPAALRCATTRQPTFIPTPTPSIYPYPYPNPYPYPYPYRSLLPLPLPLYLPLSLLLTLTRCHAAALPDDPALPPRRARTSRRANVVACRRRRTVCHTGLEPLTLTLTLTLTGLEPLTLTLTLTHTGLEPLTLCVRTPAERAGSHTACYSTCYSTHTCEPRRTLGRP